MVIVLNADYQFINVVTIKKAFSYILKGKVIVEKYTEKSIHTSEDTFQIPLVVRFTYLIRQIYNRNVPWSKKNVCIRDNYICGYCGEKGNTVDHVIPKKLGGKNTFENTVCACKSCNAKKGNKLPEECGMYPSHELVRPTIKEFMKTWYRQFNVDSIIESLWE